jgi:excisionase family DNA binding protein
MSVLTRQEAAQALKVSLRQLDRLIADGELRAFRVGTSVRIRQQDLEDFMRSGETITLDEAALQLSLTPSSLRQLVADDAIPHERRGNLVVFERRSIERWRDALARTDEPTIYGNMDSAARHLQELLAQQGKSVELLMCELCVQEVKNGARAEAWVAGVRCAMCGRAACLPHALHYLPAPLGPTKPPVACDDCYDRRQPATMNSGNPRRHRIEGHSARGECLRCAPTYPRPCRRPHCGGTIHADDASPWAADDPTPTKGPHCDTCGKSDAG